MNNAITTAAPAGKRCTQCLCCEAVIVFEGEALCAACDDGTHPPLPESRPAPLPDPPEQECATPAPKPEPESRKVSMRRLTPDEIAAIQAAPLSESTAALSRRLGLSDKAVSYQRLVFQRKQKSGSVKQVAEQRVNAESGPTTDVNIHVAPHADSASAAEFIRANAHAIRVAINEQIATAAPKPAKPDDDDWIPEPETSLPGSDDAEPSTALLCVDEDELNDWWDALEVEAKADAFVQWSLGNDGRNSHVYIEPSIPVAGTLDTAVDQAAQQ
jgi:hypothetical protein